MKSSLFYFQCNILWHKGKKSLELRFPETAIVCNCSLNLSLFTLIYTEVPVCSMSKPVWDMLNKIKNELSEMLMKSKKKLMQM